MFSGMNHQGIPNTTCGDYKEVKNKRLMNNLTNMTMMITLYVQAGNDMNNIYGTLNITLQPSESIEVEYGDLRNGYLLGLRVNPLPADPVETYYAMVKQRGDVVDSWLNNSDAIDITIQRLRSMDSHVPIEQVVRESEGA